MAISISVLTAFWMRILANDDDEYGGNEDIRAHGIKIVADANIDTLTNMLEIDSMDDNIAVVLGRATRWWYLRTTLI